MGDNEIEIVVDVDDRASDKFDSIGKAAKKVGDVAGSALAGMAGMLASAGQAAAGFATQMVTGAAGAASMGAATTVASGGMNLLVGGLLAAAGAAAAAVAGFFALAPALSLIGGLAGAAITGLFGVGIAAGTLGIGLGGVSDAWNAYGKSAGGGGAASKAAGDQAYQAARRIEQAEDGVTRAKRAAVKASEDVSRARANERERIEDLTLALRGQKFAQEDANAELKTAEEKLAREMMFGNSTSQNAAQKEVDRAKYRYDYETERLKDLEEDKAKADKNGVEGSDQVKSALERERDAAEAVTTAMEALADAKRKVETASGGAGGGVNAFADAMNKLSPNAQKFVQTLISLKERFADVKREVQDRLFAGLDESLENLADNWGPKLIPILGGMADALNRVAQGIMEAFGDAEFIDNVEEAGEAFEGFLESIGNATEKMIDAFGRIAGASGPVLRELGYIIEDIATGFAEWIEEADKSGGLETFMENAAKYLRQIYEIGGSVIGIVGEFIEILFPGSDAAGGGLLESIKQNLDKVKEWLGDPENQEQIRQMIRDFGDFFKKLVTKWIPDLIKFGQEFGALVTPLVKVIVKLSEINNWITVKLPAAIKSMSGKGGDIFNGVKAGFRSAVNWIIGKWNGLQFTLPSATLFGQQIGGGTIGTHDIDYLATGGISGAGRTIMNERGPEMVKLPTGSMVYPAGDSARMAGGGGGSVDLNVRVDRTTERGIVDALFSMIRFEIGSRYGGDVQLALGENR